MYINDKRTNEQKVKGLTNNGSICQITRVEKISFYYNQYDYEDIIIKPGQTITTMDSKVSQEWDSIARRYDNNWDTIVECFARKVYSFHYKSDFDEYTETKYTITRVVDIDQDWYIDKIKDDILWKHEVSNGVYTNTPLSHQTRMDEIEELEDIEDLVEGGEY